MYHSVTPVTNGHDPIIVEGSIETQLLLFNAGPASIEARVWKNWEENLSNQSPKDLAEPNLKLELRAGGQKIITGSFIRVRLKPSPNNPNDQFAAVGSRVLWGAIDTNSFI